MALKLTVDSLDGIEENLRPLYVEKDGKFTLAVEGIDDTTGLKSALNAERRRASDLEKKVKKWEGLGKTDEEIAALLADHEETERKKAEAAGDHAKILKQHQEKWEKEKQGLEAELTAARSSERGAIIGNSVMSALSKAGATDEGVDLLPDRLAGRIKFETEDGKRVLKIMQADGVTPMAGDGSNGTATIDDLVKEAVQKWPSLFKGSGHSGSGMRPNGAEGVSPTGSVKRKADLKSRAERAAYVDKHGHQAYFDLPA